MQPPRQRTPGQSVMLTVAEWPTRVAFLHEDHMSKFHVFSGALAVLAVFVASPAFAQQDLAQKKNCMACHAVDKKLVGPAYKDVAAKYAGQKDAVDKLTQKVLKGGSGNWGAVPMPANPQVTEAEAKQLVQWVLSQKEIARLTIKRPASRGVFHGRTGVSSLVPVGPGWPDSRASTCPA